MEPDQWASVRARLHGEASINEVLTIRAFDGTFKTIQNSAVPIRDVNDAIIGAVVINEDISARERAERERDASFAQVRELAARLMEAQDDERRRIAQMLHETTVQDLVAIKMYLARLTRTAAGLSDADRTVLEQALSLSDTAMTALRTLSYLLPPPFLDEAGLPSALRWY